MINIEPEYDLAYKINKHLGEKVDFDNGCHLNLEEENGIIKGKSPDQIDWSCTVDDYFMDNIIHWLTSH